jgi:GNAT superfamily N-acetyltransferase
MLDLNVWVDDIFYAIKSLKGIIIAEDSLLLNAAIFRLMKSPLWDFELKGASLSVHQDGSGYSFITLPSLNDPANNSLLIRDEMLINPLSYRYEYSEYSDEQEVWEFNKNAMIITHEKPINVPFLDGVIELLSKKDKYQALLTTDPVQIIYLMAKRNEVSFETYMTMDVSGFNSMSGMSTYSANTAREVFGHRYANEMCNRIHIVARNFLGPVGIIAMFDHSCQKSGSFNHELLSVSYIYVSPGYRQAGIASSLMKLSFEYCLEHKKLLGRTSPTEIGKLTADHFSDLAQQHAPLLPFLKSEELELLNSIYRKLDDLSIVSYESKCAYIQKALSSVRGYASDGHDLNNGKDKALHKFFENTNTATSCMEFKK